MSGDEAGRSGGGFLAWAEDAVDMAVRPHDRPAPSMRSPCVAWGFAVRPRAEVDPVSAETQADEARLREAWTSELDRFLRGFEHKCFAAGFEADRPRSVRVPRSWTPNGPAGAVEDDRVGVGSRYFQIIWRGIPGVVQAQSHTEFATFLFVLGARLHRRAMFKRRVRTGLSEDPTFGDKPDFRELAAALDLLAAPDRVHFGQDRRGADPVPVAAFEAARDLAFEGIWDRFAGDLSDALRDANRPVGAPGEAFSSVRMAILRTDRLCAWPDGPVDVSSMHVDQQTELLRRRINVVDRLFPESPEREFVANGAERSRHVLISSLNSTLLYEREEAERVGAAPPTPTTRLVVFLDARPDGHQLGRLVERLHSMHVYRIASLFDLESLRIADSELRHLGRRLDRFFLAEVDQRRDDATSELRVIFRDLQRLGRDVRGGLSYRLSRAALYVSTFERRMDELKVAPIPTWQPYDEFIRRRLRRTFDFIEDIGERRDRLFQRLTLLLERLQWDELNDVQRGAERTLRATDMVAYVGIVLGAGAIGGAAGMATVVEFDWLRPLLPTALHAPLTEGPDAERDNAALFGAVIGLGLGVLGCFVLGSWRAFWSRIGDALERRRADERDRRG